MTTNKYINRRSMSSTLSCQQLPGIFNDSYLCRERRRVFTPTRRETMRLVYDDEQYPRHTHTLYDHPRRRPPSHDYIEMYDRDIHMPPPVEHGQSRDEMDIIAGNRRVKEEQQQPSWNSVTDNEIKSALSKALDSAAKAIFTAVKATQLSDDATLSQLFDDVQHEPDLQRKVAALERAALLQSRRLVRELGQNKEQNVKHVETNRLLSERQAEVELYKRQIDNLENTIAGLRTLSTTGPTTVTLEHDRLQKEITHLREKNLSLTNDAIADKLRYNEAITDRDNTIRILRRDHGKCVQDLARAQTTLNDRRLTVEGNTIVDDLKYRLDEAERTYNEELSKQNVTIDDLEHRLDDAQHKYNEELSKQNMTIDDLEHRLDDAQHKYNEELTKRDSELSLLKSSVVSTTDQLHHLDLSNKTLKQQIEHKDYVVQTLKSQVPDASVIDALRKENNALTTQVSTNEDTLTRVSGIVKECIDLMCGKIFVALGMANCNRPFSLSVVDNADYLKRMLTTISTTLSDETKTGAFVSNYLTLLTNYVRQAQNNDEIKYPIPVSVKEMYNAANMVQILLEQLLNRNRTILNEYVDSIKNITKLHYNFRKLLYRELPGPHTSNQITPYNEERADNFDIDNEDKFKEFVKRLLAGLTKDVADLSIYAIHNRNVIGDYETTIAAYKQAVTKLSYAALTHIIESGVYDDTWKQMFPSISTAVDMSTSDGVQIITNATQLISLINSKVLAGTFHQNDKRYSNLQSEHTATRQALTNIMNALGYTSLTPTTVLAITTPSTNNKTIVEVVNSLRQFLHLVPLGERTVTVDSFNEIGHKIINLYDKLNDTKINLHTMIIDITSRALGNESQSQRALTHNNSNNGTKDITSLVEHVMQDVTTLQSQLTTLVDHTSTQKLTNVTSQVVDVLSTINRDISAMTNAANGANISLPTDLSISGDALSEDVTTNLETIRNRVKRAIQFAISVISDDGEYPNSAVISNFIQKFIATANIITTTNEGGSVNKLLMLDNSHLRRPKNWFTDERIRNMTKILSTMENTVNQFMNYVTTTSAINRPPSLDKYYSDNLLKSRHNINTIVASIQHSVDSLLKIIGFADNACVKTSSDADPLHDAASLLSASVTAVIKRLNDEGVEFGKKWYETLSLIKDRILHREPIPKEVSQLKDAKLSLLQIPQLSLTATHALFGMMAQVIASSPKKRSYPISHINEDDKAIITPRRRKRNSEPYVFSEPSVEPTTTRPVSFRGSYVTHADITPSTHNTLPESTIARFPIKDDDEFFVDDDNYI